MNKSFLIFAAFVFGVFLATLYFESCSDHPKGLPEIGGKDTVLKHDTLWKEIKIPEIAGKGKGRVQYLPIEREERGNDSLLTFEAFLDSTRFIAVIDTVQNEDTLHLEYHFPAAVFKWKINRSADSVEIVNETKIINNYIQPPWYERPAFTIPATLGVVATIILLVR